MSYIFGVKEQKYVKNLASQFPKLEIFRESVELLSRNCDPNMTQNEHVCVICCRPEVGCDVISGEKVETVLGYIVVNFEVAISSRFRDIKKNHFVTAEAADIDDSLKCRTSLNEKVCS